MMDTKLLTLVLVAMFASTEGHKLGFGPCANVQSMADFDISKVRLKSL